MNWAIPPSASWASTCLTTPPLRHYYLFRNALLLQRMPHIGWRWKVVDAYQTVMKYGFYALVATPRLPRIRMMNRGLWDGLLGRGGAYRPR